MPQKDVLLYASLLHRELCLVTVICTQTSFHNQTHVFSVAASITWNVFMTCRVMHSFVVSTCFSCRSHVILFWSTPDCSYTVYHGHDQSWKKHIFLCCFMHGHVESPDCDLRLLSKAQTLELNFHVRFFLGPDAPLIFGARC